MKLVKILNDQQTVEDLRSKFEMALPFPMISLDNFLEEDFAKALYSETNQIDNSLWKNFTRKGSHMLEFNKLEMIPNAFDLVSFMHSSIALEWLEKITGINGLMPDPYLIGAGYSKSFTGDTLKVHTDFNWNDKLKLHRALSVVIYLTPNWQTEWGGGLNFYDQDKQHVVTRSTCLFNQCLIWKYDKYGYHGYEEPLLCPNDINRTTFRIFYYTSNSTYLEDDLPHRSLYWFDDKEKRPYDKREEI